MGIGRGQVRDHESIVCRDALGQLVVRGPGGHADEIPGARELGFRVDAQLFHAGEVGRLSDRCQPMLNDRLELHLQLLGKREAAAKKTGGHVN